MNITFIGNCQTLSLCFYFQQLNIQKYNCNWCLYGDEFKQHLSNWVNKCENKIYDYDVSIELIKNSDIIIYQEIDVDKSYFCNTIYLQKIMKSSCKLIKIPSIYLIYNDFDNSIKELIERENKNNVDIKISNILCYYKENNIMLTSNHPTTFLFLEIIKIICGLLNENFCTEDQCNIFLKNENYIELP